MNDHAVPRWIPGGIVKDTDFMPCFKSNAGEGSRQLVGIDEGRRIRKVFSEVVDPQKVLGLGKPGNHGENKWNR